MPFCLVRPRIAPVKALLYVATKATVYAKKRYKKNDGNLCYKNIEKTVHFLFIFDII